MQAQQLIGDFERTGVGRYAEEALKLLDEYADESVANARKSDNLKRRLSDIIQLQLGKILEGARGFKMDNTGPRTSVLQRYSMHWVKPRRTDFFDSWNY